MVNSRQNGTMTEGMERLPERLEVVEQKIDALTTSVDARFEAVVARFDALTASVDARFEAVDARFDALTASIDARFEEVAQAFVEQRQYTEFAFNRLATEMCAGFRRVDERLDQLAGRLDRVEVRLDRVERKLDQFISTQSRANAIAERRLRRLESRI